ncbi:MAG: glycosyltransferase family 2 protein [Chitinophagaceae bacterium]
MEVPLVSVIMPVFNAEKFLPDSIGSLLNQTYKNWELLVTDDGSTDGSASVINSFPDARIKLFSQQNKGVGAARNAALSKMQGVYFTFLDADDILPPDSLSSRVDFAEHNQGINIVGGNVAFFNQHGVQRTWKADYLGDPFHAFTRIDERAFCNPSLFIRRITGIDYSFRQGLTHVEDLLFFTYISGQQPQVYASLDKLVYLYRVSDSSAMSNLRGLEKGYWTFYDFVKNQPKALPSNIRYLKWRIIRIMGLSYLAAGKFFDALKVVPKILSK